MSDNLAANFSQRVSPRWEAATTVENFRTSPPNDDLLQFACEYRAKARTTSAEPLRVLDIGGGAGRNAVPLARLGLEVLCTDLSSPMLQAAQVKLHHEPATLQLSLLQAPMSPLPLRDDGFDLIVAHGIWNLARTGTEFRSAVAEAARVARPGAGLFLFTFSRHTIPESDSPVAGETFVFTQFNGEPQCFLSEAEIMREMEHVGFVLDPVAALREINRPSMPRTLAQGPPVLYQATFTYRP
jgi:ubiquinone/menaquinone biosynthesis C-methylase UbiE